MRIFDQVGKISTDATRNIGFFHALATPAEGNPWIPETNSHPITVTLSQQVLNEISEHQDQQSSRGQQKSTLPVCIQNAASPLHPVIGGGPFSGFDMSLVSICGPRNYDFRCNYLIS